jgi:HK97 gp10 family phage protein
VQLSIKGLKETQANMERILKELEGPPMDEAMRDATPIAQRDAQRNVPVLTGRLQASITSQVVTQGKTVQGVIGSNVIYAPFVEYGTRRMRARRFLRNALENNEEEITRKIEGAVKEITKA